MAGDLLAHARKQVVIVHHLLLCLLAFSCTASAECHFKNADQADVVTYRFIPRLGPGALTLHVRFEFRMDASGVDSLILPNEWAGEKLHSISHLRSASEGVSVKGEVDTNTIRVRGPANRPVAVEYDLQRDWTGPLVNPLQFHPVLMPQYIEFTGSNALIRRNLPDQRVSRLPA